MIRIQKGFKTALHPGFEAFFAGNSQQYVMKELKEWEVRATLF